jgi:hypothetical protein
MRRCEFIALVDGAAAWCPPRAQQPHVRIHTGLRKPINAPAVTEYGILCSARSVVLRPGGGT